jgi:DNA-binding MarR family transcriptional regulator
MQESLPRYIVLRYTISMGARMTADKYRALAELRYRIRRFLHDGDALASAAGLKPQQYLMLLAIRGLPQGGEATIRTLADRVVLKHHSTVELIDRLEKHGYVCRRRGYDDRRLVTVSLLLRGERVLEGVARHRITELRSNGRQLVHAINQLLEHTRRPRSGNDERNSRRGREKRG